MIEEKAYAKVNLGLSVRDLRSDGYHEIETIMIPIDLYDEITFSEASDIIYRTNVELEDDIVLKAVACFYKKYKINKGVCISLEKGIPISAGLAGGSADAAATLRGLNRYFNVNASNEELSILASELGSDVVFCLYNVAAVCSGRGEIIETIESNLDKYNITLIKPTFGMSTKAIYEEYKYDGNDNKEKLNNIKIALKNNDIKLLKENIFNDLNKVSLNVSDELKDIYDICSDNKVFISGSGPTLFVIDEDINTDTLKQKYDDISILKTKLL